jgi:uncharacterized protein
MAAPDFFANENFLVPGFQIKLEGLSADKGVLHDVQEVTFTDDMVQPSFFEIVLNDWDPLNKAVKYSSPWNETGMMKKLEGGGEMPVFEPGKKLSLAFGYSLTKDAQAIIEAEIVSISASFPASGLPSVRIRAVDADWRALQRIQIDKTFDGTAKSIAEQLCAGNNYFTDFGEIADPGKPKEKFAVEGSLFDALSNLAKEYKLNLAFLPKQEGATNKTITFSKLATGQDTPVAEFIWGRTLQSFTPVLSASAQVGKVVVRSGDPTAKGAKQKVDVEKTWDDVPWVKDPFGPGGLEMLKAASLGKREIVKPDKPLAQEDAELEALARLEEMASTLVTANGTSIGLPQLRAGKTIGVYGIGVRFEGVYRLTQTTHTLGGSGYATSFQARKEVLAKS